MMHSNANPPIVLSFSALDPSGAGGIQADIETCASLGCHCAPIATSLCATGNTNSAEVIAIPTTILIEQARSILDAMDVAAIKIGFLGSRENAEAIHSIIADYKNIPVVSHPALCLYDEDNSEHDDLIGAYSTLILPESHIANLSLFEARKISRESDTIDTTAHAVLAFGCKKILITGTGKQTQAFQNSVFDEKGLVRNYPWEQEPTACYGASSTLSASMASYIAHGFNDSQAIEQAQNYTWRSMFASRDLGFEKRTPHRLYWADKNIDANGSKHSGVKSH